MNELVEYWMEKNAYVLYMGEADPQLIEDGLNQVEKQIKDTGKGMVGGGLAGGALGAALGTGSFQKVLPKKLKKVKALGLLGALPGAMAGSMIGAGYATSKNVPGNFKSMRDFAQREKERQAKRDRK